MSSSPRLCFPIDGSKVGRPFALAQHCVAEPDTVCRELIQNSLDAHAATRDDGPCRVVFRTSRSEVKDLPGYEDYRQALQRAEHSWHENEEVSAYLANLRDCLRESERFGLDILFVSDNGAGFSEKGLEAVMAEGAPEKQDGSSGSFGIGHLTAYGISGLQYICYASKQRDGRELMAGHAILAAHESSEGKLLSGNGYYVEDYIPRFHQPFSFCGAEHIPAFLRQELDRIEGSGSVIAVLGFNRFRRLGGKRRHKKSLNQLVCEAAAENFAIAVWEGRLEIEVHSSEAGELVESEEKIDKDEIDNFLAYMARPETGTKEQTQKAKQTLEAIKTHGSAETPEGSSGRLSGEFRDCRIYLRNRAPAHVVSVWRNGMLITRKHRGLARDQFDNKKPLDAVVLLSGREDPRAAHDLVKKAETPLHDRIVEERLDKPEDKQRLRKLLDEIRKWISERAEDSGGTSTDLVSEVMLDAGNVVQAKLTRQPKMFDDATEGQPEGADRRGKKRKKDKKSKSGHRVSRRIVKIRAQGRVLDDGRYRVGIRPEDGGSLSGQVKVIVDSGQDPSCSGVVQDRALAVKAARGPHGEKYKIRNGMVQVPSGLGQEASLVMDLEFAEPPADLGQVALGCLVNAVEKAP